MSDYKHLRVSKDTHRMVKSNASFQGMTIDEYIQKLLKLEEEKNGKK